MTGRVPRTAAALLIAPFLAFASALAPQHVHEPGGHDDDHAVAHSHFAPHESDHHHGGLEIEQDEAHHGPVVWAANPILHEGTYRAVSMPASIPVSHHSVAVELRWSVTPFDDAAPVHGPPRVAHRLRGPPLSCLL